MSITIESPHNERLKELRKLHDRKHRERTNLFLAEGEDLLAEAMRWGVQPKTVFYVADELQADAPLLRGLPPEVELVAVRRDALRASGSLGSGSRLIGIWEKNAGRRQAGGRISSTSQAGGQASGGMDAVIYLHEVSDPGNVGAVLRSALALAASVVVLSPGAADPFSPKAVRASMGAIFGQPFARASFDDLRAELAEGSRLVALAPEAGKPLHEVDLRSPLVLCLGSERLGLPDEIVAECDQVCHVPLRPDGAESLNVAMTATLCMYELSLSRLGRRP
jgi:RNA methyltransferase, TrmH family